MYRGTCGSINYKNKLDIHTLSLRATFGSVSSLPQGCAVKTLGAEVLPRLQFSLPDQIYAELQFKSSIRAEMAIPDSAHRYLIDTETVSFASLPAAQHQRIILANAAISLASAFVFLTAVLCLRWWKDGCCGEKEGLSSSRGQPLDAPKRITKSQLLDLDRKIRDLGQKLREQAEALPEGTALPPGEPQRSLSAREMRGGRVGG